MGTEKTHVNTVVTGLADSGKSTPTGHLIYTWGATDKRPSAKCEKESAEMGKGSFKHAWVLDKQKAECEHGITIDISLEFGVGNSKNGHTPEHSPLACRPDVEQLIVVVHKMDFTEPPYSRRDMRKSLRTSALTLRKWATALTLQHLCQFLIGMVAPCRSHVITGLGSQDRKSPVNMADAYGILPLEVLDSILPPTCPIDKSLHLPLQDVYEIWVIGTVSVGQLDTGALKPVSCPPLLQSTLQLK
ncbi:hypothetical protein P7K49_008612 [Saguinus oedipus]|uniref:Tr-type G domain-containing protein n=1 Tax=Saguinus oedipus TaxID=9490 RepID=A0ABQ9VY83_SAGOE|nr:hypothetical protein P7K49_008612 [Saguinus oedipus]